MPSPAPLSAPILTPAQIADFGRDGFVHLPSAISSDAAASLKAWAAELEALPEETGRHWVYHETSQLDGSPVVNRIEKISPFHPGFADLNRALAAPAGQVLGERVCLFKEKLNFKKPGGGGFEPHQDMQAGWSEYAASFVTVVVCIDEGNATNGCLEIASGQHRRGLLGGQEPLSPSALAGTPFQAYPTQPGDVIFLDAYTPHQSGPNRGQAQRRMYYVTYNKASEGDQWQRYHSDKHRSYPPDIDRDPGREYRYKI